MVKVLLVFEDFNEVTLTETYLKKVGFDVVSITNERNLSDQLLIFNPDVVVAYGKNNRVSSFSVGQKMKENHRFQGKLLILVSKGVRPAPSDIIKMKVDGILDAPVDQEKLVFNLAKLAGENPTPYIEKLMKTRLAENPEANRRPSSSGILSSSNNAGTGNPPNSIKSEEFPKEAPNFSDAQRMQKYSKFIDEAKFDVQQSTFKRKDIKDQQSKMKKDWDSNKLGAIDELKRKFVEALFRKK